MYFNSTCLRTCIVLWGYDIQIHILLNSLYYILVVCVRWLTRLYMYVDEKSHVINANLNIAHSRVAI